MICRFLLLATLLSTVSLTGIAAEPAKFDEATRSPYTDPPGKSRNGKSIVDMIFILQPINWNRFCPSIIDH